MPFQHPADDGLEDEHGAELGTHQDQAEHTAAQEPEPVALRMGPEFGEHVAGAFPHAGARARRPWPSRVLAGHLHPDAGCAGLRRGRRGGAGRFAGVFFRGAGMGSLSDISNS